MTGAPGALSPLDEDGINAAVEEALATFAAAGTPAELKEACLAHTGDVSSLTLANRLTGTLDRADRPIIGKFLGNARGRIAKALTARQETLEAVTEKEMLYTKVVDVAIPTSCTQAGARHPLDVLVDGVCDFFTSMGWSIVEGSEAEHEWFDFDALNFDTGYPVHQMQDVFYIDGASVGVVEGQAISLVLHTHTSLVQTRVMPEQQPPLYVVCPGKVFRPGGPDVIHTPVFHQVEGPAVDKGLTMAHLKGVLSRFVRAMFGLETCTRLCPFFFPFTESSAEMDLWFPQKKGGAGWIEWRGCGMVNLNVLTTCGIDPEVHMGFAFDMDLEHVLMLHHGITDVHDIVEGGIHFSQQLSATGKGD